MYRRHPTDDGRAAKQTGSGEPDETACSVDCAALDDDGVALVIHSAAEDYRSRLSGATGDRIAYEVIKQD